MSRRVIFFAVAVTLASVAWLSAGGNEASIASPSKSSDGLWRDLLHESALAELEVAGTLIDFGTADQHKYTRGGWATGWGRLDSERNGPSYAEVTARDAHLTLMAHHRPRELVLRARARSSRQELKAYWNGTGLRQADGERSSRIGRGWQEIRFEIPKQLASRGRHEVRLSFRSARPLAADIDWLWIRTHQHKEPPELVSRMAPLRLGKRTRRSLVAPTARAYSFYLHVPARGRLAFDYGSDRQVEFRVSAQTARGQSYQLFRQQSSPGTWRSASVDLSRFSGQAIRLELATEGPNGRTGWGAPEIRAPDSVTGPRPTRAVAGVKPAKNVIVVVYDTTRADVFAPFASSSRVKTPHFNALAASSTRFSNAYNNESWTRPSVVTILTGLYPNTHGALYARSVLSDKVEMLSEHLSKHDFQTLAIVGNPVLRAKFGMDQGWDEYRNHGRDDDSAARIYTEATQWVESNHHRGRFFLYVQSHDNHTPYDPERSYSKLYHPEPYSGFVGDALSADEQNAIGKGKRRAKDSDLAWIRALYDGEATYQDKHFGRMIAKLEELGILDQTLVVVTNDHGEEFTEHGGMGHGWTLYEEQLEAPLIMRYPALFGRGTAISEIVEHVDVAPTIVETLGLPPLPRADGLSLLPLVTGRGAPPRPYYAVAALRDEERSIRVGRWKLLVDKDKGWESLYDLERDPGEKSSHIDTRQIAGRLCEIYLGEALASPAKGKRLSNISTHRRFEAPTMKLDRKTKRDLEALGYFGEDVFTEDSDKK